MKWITREHVKVDRVACPWLITKFVDKDAEFLFVPTEQVLEAIAEGFRHLGFKDDHEQNAAEWIVYDALYAYCQEMVRQGKPDGAFKADPSGSPAPNINPYDRTGQQAGPKQ